MQRLRILHFNDVYELAERDKEPVGGAARFKRCIDMQFPGESPEPREEDAYGEPLVLFSGDCLNPSLLSTVTRGRQMAPVLKGCRVSVAVYGNHDFDFGEDQLEKVASDTGAVWLLSNCDDAETGEPLAGGKRYHVMEWNGVRLGLMGLIEQEWLQTLATIEPADVRYTAPAFRFEAQLCLLVRYTDFVDAARDLERLLREEEGCDIVIALTHMRVPNDYRLAREVPQLDLVLGGHDHTVEDAVSDSGVRIVKSGTDFRKLGDIRLSRDRDDDTARWTAQVHFHNVSSEIPEDPEMRAVVDEYQEMLGNSMDKIIGRTGVPLEARFAYVRTCETNIGNFVTDLMRQSVSADIAVLNSGTIRADDVIPVGDIRMRDLVNLFPMPDPLVKLQLTGPEVLEVLENGVSQFPRLEGRFLQVSGVMFAFDPSRSSGHRVLRESVLVGDKKEPLQLEAPAGNPLRTYTVATKAYLAMGKDGFSVLGRAPVLVDAEQGPILPTLFRNHLRILSALNGFVEFRSKSDVRMKEAWRARLNRFRARIQERRRKEGTQKEGSGSDAAAAQGGGAGGSGGGREGSDISIFSPQARRSPEEGGAERTFSASKTEESRLVHMRRSVSTPLFSDDEDEASLPVRHVGSVEAQHARGGLRRHGSASMLQDFHYGAYVLHPTVEGRIVNIQADSPSVGGWQPPADARPTEEEDQEERERQKEAPVLADEDGAF